MNFFTNLSRKITIFLFVLMAFSNLLLAQDEESTPALVIGGSVDTYFRYNLNSANNPAYGTVAPGSSFANLPGFSLGMVNLIASYDGEKTGFVADLVYGPRGTDAVFGSVPSQNIVNQLYVYWQASESLKLTMGNFNTFLGYELISPTGNFNYSTSYMFSYGPFSHSGLKADLSFGEGFSFMASVLNPTDATDFNPNNTYYGGLQLGYSNDAGGIWLNSLFTDGFYQLDITTGWDVSEKVFVGVNATTAKDSFLGAAGYFQVATSDALKLGLRGEYFQDKGLGIFTKDESVFDLTVTANYSLGNLTFIPEIRLDAFSQKDFVVKDVSDPLDPKLSENLTSFVLAAVFAF